MAGKLPSVSVSKWPAVVVVVVVVVVVCCCFEHNEHHPIVVTNVFTAVTIAMMVPM